MKGLTSSHNSLIGSDIVYAGETVYERLTANSSYDNWWFTAPADGHVNIILQSKEFNAYLELYDANGNLIAGMTTVMMILTPRLKWTCQLQALITSTSGRPT